MLKWFIKIIGSIFLFVVTGCGVKKSLNYVPQLSKINKSGITFKSDSLLVANDNYLKLNKYKNWELKVSGNPQEIGYYSGLLTESLYKNQEKVFFSNVKNIIPSSTKQKLLIKFLRWYSNQMYLNIPLQYQQEIFELSQFSNEKFNWVAPKFQRALYLHGAHDIGHAMQDLALVGCSSLAVWDKKSQDKGLLIGRNFDFYAGDDFAKNKLIQFIQPDKGYAFASVSWPGMVGVVSGMNVNGITVTLNAGKSDIGLKAKNPVSIVAREIIQYAGSLSEAIEIAKKHKVFVSESLLIGSGKERKAIIIEISPNKIDVYNPSGDYTICTNHFQSDIYKTDQRNIDAIQNSHTKYRFDKIEEKVAQIKVWNPEKMAKLLRDTSGLNNHEIGLGNEKSLNQLIAHHAVIFQPEQLKMWVSSSPYQLGEMACYHLNDIFSDSNFKNKSLVTQADNIELDSLAKSQQFTNYEKYREILKYLEKEENLDSITESDLIEFQKLNPNLWKVYDISAKIQYKKGYYLAAKNSYLKALNCEIATQTDKNRIQKAIHKIHKKL